MPTKYTLKPSSEAIPGGRVLSGYRVVAEIDIPAHGVRKGDEGGLVASPENLAQEGNCWCVKGTRIAGEGRVRGNAVVRDAAVVCDNAEVTDDAVIGGAAMISGRAKVINSGKVGRVRMIDNPLNYSTAAKAMAGEAMAGEVGAPVNSAQVESFDTCVITDDAVISEHGSVEGSAVVRDRAKVRFGGSVIEDAIVGGDWIVEGMVRKSVILVGTGVVPAQTVKDSNPPIEPDDMPEFRSRSE